MIKCYGRVVSSQVPSCGPLLTRKATMGMNVNAGRLHPTGCSCLEDHPFKVGKLLQAVVDAKGPDAL